MDNEDVGWFKLLKWILRIWRSWSKRRKESWYNILDYLKKIIFRVQGVITEKEIHSKHWTKHWFCLKSHFILKIVFLNCVYMSPILCLNKETQPHGSLRILHSTASNISRQCRETRDTEFLLFLFSSDAQTRSKNRREVIRYLNILYLYKISPLQESTLNSV